MIYLYCIAAAIFLSMFGFFFPKKENNRLHWSHPKYIAGLFDPKYHADFVKIPAAYSDDKRYMRVEAFRAFKKMAQAAKKDNVKLQIVSATRNFYAQKKIWEDKWTGKELVDGISLPQVYNDPMLRAIKILEYSAPPGLSRHHWGTDIDLNSVETEYFETEYGQRVYQWLTRNAGQFGFKQTYTAKDSSRPAGFQEEKWHWSYVPLSSQIWKKQIEQFENKSPLPFLGDEYVFQLPILEHYIKMVNQ